MNKIVFGSLEVLCSEDFVTFKIFKRVFSKILKPCHCEFCTFLVIKSRNLVENVQTQLTSHLQNKPFFSD